MPKFNIKVGDRIKFRAWHSRVGFRTAVRKVVSLWVDGRPQVGMFGWAEFVVNWNEIIEVYPAQAK